MKTIYFYGIDNIKGGIESYAFNLIKGIKLNEPDFNFHIITEYENFTYKDELVKNFNCKYSIVPNKRKHPFKYCKAIKNILKNAKKDDLCHLNLMSYRNFLLLHSVKKTKINTIIVGHATKTNNFINTFIHKFFRIFYKNFSTNIANNELVKNYMFGKNSNAKIIQFGFDPSKYIFNKCTRDAFRKKYGISDEDFIIGQVGRISKAKNYDFSFKLLSTLKNDKNIKFAIFGKDTNNKYKKLCKKFRLKNVFYFGETENMPEIYNIFDIFIFPSLFESAGFALYEALANGCYSLTSKNVPLESVKSDRLSILELDINKWNKKIIEIKTNKYIRDNSKLSIRRIEDQISDYINLYKLIN